MSTINEYYLFGELAFATYSDWYQGITDVDYITALKREGKGMSQAQSQEFIKNYTVIDQYNPPNNGLSVTLFTDKDGNQTIAIRGTTPTDLYDLVTDIIDIAILGTVVFQAQYKALSDKIHEWREDGTLSSGFSVTGHSLGGFLAQALTLEFDSNVSSAYTYNAPGFTTPEGIANYIAEALDRVGLIDATIPNDKIINIQADEGPELTAGFGQLVGDFQLVSIEDQAPDYFDNHSMVHLTDALAVYNLFSNIDTSLTIADITAVFDASSKNENQKLESSVTKLGELFVDGFVSRGGSEYDSNRDLLYTDIQAINEALPDPSTLTIELLGTTDATDTFIPFAPYEIENRACDDIAYRYALVNLNTFAIVGVDYSEFNQNGELEIYNEATTLGRMTRMNSVHGAVPFSLTILEAA